jgi:hypothetical protein
LPFRAVETGQPSFVACAIDWNLTGSTPDPATRERNTIVARELLPLFEAQPSGWDALAALNLCARDPQMTLPRFLEEWRDHAGKSQYAFIDRVRATLGFT